MTDKNNNELQFKCAKCGAVFAARDILKPTTTPIKPLDMQPSNICPKCGGILNPKPLKK